MLRNLIKTTFVVLVLISCSRQDTINPTLNSLHHVNQNKLKKSINEIIEKTKLKNARINHSYFNLNRADNPLNPYDVHGKNLYGALLYGFNELDKLDSFSVSIDTLSSFLLAFYNENEYTDFTINSFRRCQTALNNSTESIMNDYSNIFNNSKLSFYEIYTASVSIENLILNENTLQPQEKELILTDLAIKRYIALFVNNFDFNTAAKVNWNRYELCVEESLKKMMSNPFAVVIGMFYPIEFVFAAFLHCAIEEYQKSTSTN